LTYSPSHMSSYMLTHKSYTNQTISRDKAMNLTHSLFIKPHVTRAQAQVPIQNLCATQHIKSTYKHQAPFHIIHRNLSLKSSSHSNAPSSIRPTDLSKKLTHQLNTSHQNASASSHSILHSFH
jgi:hypothetical protein